MKKYKKIWTLLGLFLLFLPAYIFFFGSQRVLAYDTSSQVKQCIDSMKFVDVAHIQCSDGSGTVTFTDKDPTDDTDNYAPDAGAFCSDNATVISGRGGRTAAFPVSPSADTGINLNLDGRLGVSDSSGPITATIHLAYASGSDCVPYGTPDGSSSVGVPKQGQTTNLPKNVTIDQPGNVLNLLTWNGENIVSPAGVSGGSLNNKNFSRISGEDPANGNLLFGSGDFSASDCKGSVIAISPLGNNGTEYELSKGSANLPDDLATLLSGDGCNVSKTNFGMSDYNGTTFGIAGTAPSDLSWDNSGSPGQPGGGGNGNGGGSVQKGGACNAGSDCKNGVCQKDQGDCQNDSCAQLSASPFSWFLCPTLDIAEKGSNFLLRIFESQLSFTISDLNGGNNCQTQATNSTCSDCQNKTNNDPNACQEKVKRAWSVIRDISSAMLVIALLIMVISQAVSWGPFDAYTIKKMLPRIVIAIILIQISWDLFAWVVDLVNGIGKGLADLMYYPFGGSANLDLGSLLANANIGNTTQSSVTWGLVAILGALAATVLAVAALPALIAAVITAMFSLLTGIITLMFRKVLIIMCLIFSPLALLMWLLPGTQSYYKLWKDNFIKALMMFPLVVAMVAAGRIFAYITGTQDTGVASVALNFIFILVGYFAPLFILPKTFKWGGSLMSTVGGTIQSTLKPASEGLSKFGREYGDRWQGSKANQYDPNVTGFRGWRDRTKRRIQSGHILPTARDRKLAIQKGDKWSAEEDEIGAAYANRAYGRALETGYQDREANGDLKFEKNEDGSDKLDAQGNKIPVMLTGTAAAKQALVDLAHHDDRKIAKGAIGRLIKTASWPEIQSSVDAKGRRIYEDNPNWGNTVSKDETLYPSVLKSRVDTAPHIVYSAEKRVAAGEGKMREEMTGWGISEADQQAILTEGATDNYKRFKAIYQMRYALHDQMSPEDFATQSEGFWDEAAKLANGAGGSIISAELKDRLEDIAKTGTSGQQIFGHMAGGTLQPKVDSVLSGGRDTKDGWKPNTPNALNTYIDQAVGVSTGSRQSTDQTTQQSNEGTITTEGVDIDHTNDDTGGTT